MKCSACAYYRKDVSECRRHAPLPLGYRQFAQWPKVKETDGCGEFSAAMETLEPVARHDPAHTPQRICAAAE
jgi:hypothetical protein